MLAVEGGRVQSNLRRVGPINHTGTQASSAVLATHQGPHDDDFTPDPATYRFGHNSSAEGGILGNFARRPSSERYELLPWYHLTRGWTLEIL